MSSKNRARAIAALALFALLFVAGCVTGEIRQRITADGETFNSMDLVLNLTSLFIQQEAPALSYDDFNALMKTQLCPQLSEGFNLTNSTCDVQYLFLTYSGNSPGENITEADGFVKKNHLLTTEYSLRPNMSGMSGAFEDTSKLEEARAQGLKMAFILEVPGQIQYASGGTILNGTMNGQVRFDIIDLLATRQAIAVTSKDYNKTSQSAIAIAALLLITGTPFVRRFINRKQKNSLYKDRPGTVMFVSLMTLLVSMLFFIQHYFLFGPAEGQFGTFVHAVVLCMLMTIIVAFYVGNDFEVSQEGIVYRSSFAKKTIRFSEIKKIERSILKFGFSGGMGYRAAAPSGAVIKPTIIEFRWGRSGRKGILLTLKDGRTMYYPVKDIAWVIDTVDGKIR